MNRWFALSRDLLSSCPLRRPLKVMLPGLCLLFLSLISLYPCLCQGQTAERDRLIVGVTPDPPYLIKEKDGEWGGLNTSLWKAVAQELKIDYELREMTFDELLDALKENRIDLSIDTFYVTAERQKRFDYSFPFGNSRLAVATLPERLTHPWWTAIKIFLSWGTFKIILLLGLCLCVLGLIFWIIERRTNPDYFGGGIIKGIGSGIYWVGSTMASGVCFGVALKSLPARILGLTWMFICAIALSALIASLTSSLFASRDRTEVVPADDLRRMHLGGIVDSAESVALKNIGGKTTFFKSEQEALQALMKRRIDGFLYDEITLIYYRDNDYKDRISVYPTDTKRFFFAFALPKNSPIKSKVDYAILDYIERPEWPLVLQRYGLEENFEERMPHSYRRRHR
jgi:ABC-type amino acid transport substrate-binding protein